jgi:23S rRNA U2552 (ribose-2'-O)-methylase RlmE/FtsJ
MPLLQAKAKGYVARSAFKLLEIQQKHKIIPAGGQVLDLGCHPGAWLQVEVAPKAALK